MGRARTGSATDEKAGPPARDEIGSAETTGSDNATSTSGCPLSDVLNWALAAD
jgi:hypothetical protein